MPITRIAWEGKGVGREADDVIDTPDKLSFLCSWQGKQSQFSYNILEKLSRKKTGGYEFDRVVLLPEFA